MNTLASTMELEDQLTRYLPADSLSLTSEQVISATRLSQAAPQPWQTYLAALARLGVEQWFAERMPELHLSPQQFDPAAPLTLLNRLRVNRFQLGLVSMTDIADGLVSLPKALVEQPPDFYLLVEILEELAQIRIYGFLPASHLTDPQQLEEDEEAYLLPLSQFDTDSGKILLYIQHLVPVASPQSISLSQRTVDASRWLVNQLDQVAESLSWVLLPATPAWAMRSSRQGEMRLPSAQLDRVMSELIKRQEIELPPQIGHTYQEMQLGDKMLRLYKVVWEIYRADEPPAWMLLLILGSPTGAPLPTGVSLQIRDDAALLDRLCSTENPAPYLYTQVSGEQHERFYITVSAEQQQIELPPIGFSPAE